MRRPRLLLLYCNAGGGTVGYARAGFDVVGVDILPQPNNPAYWSAEQKQARRVEDAAFEFIQGDALETLERLDLNLFDAIHASPPCQAYSWSAKRWTNIPRADLLAPTRQALKKAGLPYVIENVIGAPMIDATVICGLSFNITAAGLHNGTWPEVLRHRQFETNWKLTPPAHVKHISGGVTQGLYVTVAGHGGENAKGKGGRAHKQRAMGIDWMTDRELNEAIPPAYLEYVGRQLHVLVSRFGRCDSADVFEAAKRGASRKWNLAAVSPRDFADCRAWLSPAGRAGFMVTSVGELVNLFNYGARGEGRNALELALACGATHLNCYDGFLVDYYKEHGFVEIGRAQFIDDFAPAGWDYAALDRPDVVFMQLKKTLPIAGFSHEKTCLQPVFSPAH